MHFECPIPFPILPHSYSTNVGHFESRQRHNPGSPIPPTIGHTFAGPNQQNAELAVEGEFGRKEWMMEWAKALNKSMDNFHYLRFSTVHWAMALIRL
jgi:hypothetical protein